MFESATAHDRRDFMKAGAAATAAALIMGAGSAQADEPAADFDGMTLDEAVQYLMDDRAIRNKLSLYQRSMDRCDAELGYAVFWDDSEIYVGEYYQGVTGKEFVDSCMEAHPGIFLTSHQITNTYITINGDKAGSESYAKPYFIYAGEDGSFSLQLQCCRYNDQWEKRDGEWRIIHRTSPIDASVVIPTVEIGAEQFEYRRDTDDVSYAALAYGQADAE